MKLISKTALTVLIVITSAFFMSGCIEHRYYRDHHDHSPEWHHRHDPHVDVNIHN